MNFRTDLALEAAADTLPAPQVRREGGVTVTHLTLNPTDAARLGRAPGRYVTVDLPPLPADGETLAALAAPVAAELTALLPAEGPVLVAALGNAAITPDALGPLTAAGVLATRHIEGEWAEALGLSDLRPVAVAELGVLGRTGVESGEQAKGLCQTVGPTAVIAVDALAARSLDRLFCTVQLSDTGIAPGSGVGNNRLPLTGALLGVPVIGIGVPTVVDAATLVADLVGTTAPDTAARMMVTPREIDQLVERAARLLALAINGALQPGYTPADLCAAAR